MTPRLLDEDDQPQTPAAPRNTRGGQTRNCAASEPPGADGTRRSHAVRRCSHPVRVFVRRRASTRHELDASLLLLPTTGFLPPTDRRVVGTIEAVERRLFVDGFVLRYDTLER